MGRLCRRADSGVRVIWPALPLWGQLAVKPPLQRACMTTLTLHSVNSGQRCQTLACRVIVFGPWGNTKWRQQLCCQYNTAHGPLIWQFPKHCWYFGMSIRTEPTSGGRRDHLGRLCWPDHTWKSIFSRKNDNRYCSFHIMWQPLDCVAFIVLYYNSDVIQSYFS